MTVGCVRLFLLAAAMTIALSAASPLRAAENASAYQKCRVLRLHGQSAQAKACFTNLTRSSSAFNRAEGFWGIEQWEDANAQFRLAYKQEQSAELRTEWGKLFFERFNPKEAVNMFNEALQVDANYAPAFLGMARVAAEGYDKQAVELAHQALSKDPNLFEAHELLSYLALEDSDPAGAAQEAQQALARSGDALQALSILAAIDFLNDKNPSDWMDRALKVNPVYGEGYSTAAHFFVINRRYDEAVGFYQKAVQLEPRLWSAHSELGMNLMRLGRIEDARKELQEAYDAHYRNAETKNALTVIDSLRNFETFHTARGSIVLDKKEAALLRPYVEAELTQSIEVYERKYKMKLPGPVRLEVYPNDPDFSVRTLGLPGQGALLGVTFGLVVAMDSPSAREPGEFNWAATLHHELSHVFVVTATAHRVPRWFTEGLAVHEEAASNPRWGDRLTPDVVMALKEKRLLPVRELERGFVRPQYPGQVQVSYYQAGKMCDYMTERWGSDAVLGMIHSFAAHKTSEHAIQDNLHVSPERLDKDFQAWLGKQTQSTVEHFDDWKKKMEAAHAALKAGKHDEALQQAQSALAEYPDYVQGGSAYSIISAAYTAKGDKARALETLVRYRDRGGRDMDLLKGLGDLEEKAGDRAAAVDTYRTATYIYLEDDAVHRRYGELALAGGRASDAIREFEAVLALQPPDVAQSHYDLARAFAAAQRNDSARDEVLLSLEAAPGFKPAQQLLLKLNK